MFKFLPKRNDILRGKLCVQRCVLFGAVIMHYLFFPYTLAISNAADCGVLQTQTEITACLGADEKKADTLLNTMYQDLISRLADVDQQNLRVAQRAWINFRDKECTFRSAPYADGSVAPSLIAGCVTALTSQRIVDLRVQLQCQEGDVSCVPHVKAGTSGQSHVTVPAHKAADMAKGSCVQAMGEVKAKEIANRCLDMSSSSHPPCNVQNSCSLMVEEIKQGCAQSGADAPKYCKEYQ